MQGFRGGADRRALGSVRSTLGAHLCRVDFAIAPLMSDEACVRPSCFATPTRELSVWPAGRYTGRRVLLKGSEFAEETRADPSEVQKAGPRVVALTLPLKQKSPATAH